MDMFRMECPECGGTGVVLGDTGQRRCSDCAGKGHVLTALGREVVREAAELVGLALAQHEKQRHQRMEHP